MRKKELEIPLRIRKLEAELKRLPESHPKYQEISDEYGRRMSGYRGEQSLTYYLSFLKEKITPSSTTCVFLTSPESTFLK